MSTAWPSSRSPSAAGRGCSRNCPRRCAWNSSRPEASNAESSSTSTGREHGGESNATGERKGVVVNLRAARVGEAFYFAPMRLEHNVDPHQRLAVDGLTCTGVPQTEGPWDWRQLLRRETSY